MRPALLPKSQDGPFGAEKELKSPTISMKADPHTAPIQAANDSRKKFTIAHAVVKPIIT
jgi:hypothetical protein